MNPEKPCRGSDQFPLRLPDGWREAIKNEAAQNRRSMNQEILGQLHPLVMKHINEANAQKQNGSVRQHRTVDNQSTKKGQ